MLTLATAQRPPKKCRFDFYLLHSVTASIGHSVFLQEKSISPAQKARFLEYTGRVFMLTYAGMGCPETRLDRIVSHPPKLPNQGWAEIFERACLHEEDGHFAKLIRCTAHPCLSEFRVKQHIFLPAGNAMIDSGLEPAKMGTKQSNWSIRGAGFPEAWMSLHSEVIEFQLQALNREA